MQGIIMKFDSKRHMAQALLEGRRFKNPRGVVIYYDANLQNPFRCGLDAMDRAWEDYIYDIWEEVETGPIPVINGAWDLCQHPRKAKGDNERHVHQELIDSYEAGQAWQYMGPNMVCVWKDCKSCNTWVEPSWSTRNKYRLHPHNDLIQAHKNGAKIQAFIKGECVDDDNPTWDTKITYQIKPATKLIYEWMFKSPVTGAWNIVDSLMTEDEARRHFTVTKHEKTGRSWEVEA
jgi:hypothetical protein